MEITFTHEDTGSRGRYVAHVAGSPETGQATYGRAGAGRIIVDHVGVPDSLRGKGVGLALVRHVIAEARREGFTIVPACSFFKVHADRNPDWADVVEGPEA